MTIVSYFSLALLLLSDTTALMFSFRRRTAATSAFCFSTSFSSFSSSFPARRNFPCSTVAWARANLYQTETTTKGFNARIYQELYGRGILQNAEWLSYAEWMTISTEFLWLFHSHHFAGKPVRALQNASCFHRLGHEIYTKYYTCMLYIYSCLLCLLKPL